MIKALFTDKALQKGAAIFLLGTMAAPLAARFGWWHFSDAFASLRMLFYFGAAVLVIALAMMCWRLVKQRGGEAVGYGVAVLIAAMPAGMMLYQMSQVKSLPFIHDISTDMDNPPLFEAVLAQRAPDDNSADYEGEAIAAQQRQAYGDIAPIDSPLQPPQALAKMAETLEALGMEIVAEDRARGRLEASDTTFWFGFVDDVVVRVTATDTGSRVDLRSASRVGKSDIGKNAARIRAIIAAYGEQ